MIEYCITCTVNLIKFMNTNSRALMENCIFVDYQLLAKSKQFLFLVEHPLG